MKKENSLKFLSSKWLMVTFLALGFLFIGNVDANAQSHFTGKINKLTDLRDTFAPSTAKYDTVQEAIDYLLVLESNTNANPNYLSEIAALTDQDPLSVAKIRKTHPTILANYTAAELANMQAMLAEFTSPDSGDPVQAQKLQWVLEVNAY